MGAFDHILDDVTKKMEPLFNQKLKENLKPFIDQGNRVEKKLDKVLKLLEQK